MDVYEEVTGLWASGIFCGLCTAFINYLLFQGLCPLLDFFVRLMAKDVLLSDIGVVQGYVCVCVCVCMYVCVCVFLLGLLGRTYFES